MLLTPSGSGNTRSAQLGRAEHIWERAAASGQLCQAAVGAGSSWAPSSPASPTPGALLCTSGVAAHLAHPAHLHIPARHLPLAHVLLQHCCPGSFAGRNEREWSLHALCSNPTDAQRFP